MILIADSGSTNTSWRLADDQNNISQYKSNGLNPYFTEAEEIVSIIQKQLIAYPGFPEPENISQLFFYGAGCGTEEKVKFMHDTLQLIFQKAIIEVHSDLLGAARGTCGHQPGIAAILGTGSNSCEYDGKNIVKNRPSLGYILGDEGSGSHIGKNLLRAFLYNEIPENIHSLLVSKSGNTRNEIIENIYRKPFPNRYLATYSKFVQHNIKDAWCKKLVYDSFSEFLDKHISHYNTENLTLNVSGSVGYYFGQILISAANDRKIRTGSIVESPIAGLVLYHLGEI